MANIKLSNVIGAPFPDYVLQQLAIRANRNAAQTRDIQDVLFVANKSAWARLVSSVNINGNQDDLVKFYDNLKLGNIQSLDPDALAKNWILEAGTSIQGSQRDALFNPEGLTLRQGIGPEGAYGLGGTAELGYRPMPGLTSIQVETLGRLGSLRQATISFKVWNINQLNVIEALYFRLGYSMLLEWGHTQYFNNIDTTTSRFNPEGVFVTNEIYGIPDPFSATPNRRKLEIQQEIARKSRETSGNYDGMLGVVSNFNWAFNQEGGYDCTVRIIGPGAIMNTVRVNQAYQLPEGDIKRFLRNQEILKKRLQQIEANQKALADKLASATGGAGGASTGAPPPVPTSFAILKEYLVTYDGADPALELYNNPDYRVIGYDFLPSGGDIKQNESFATFNTPSRPNVTTTTRDKRLQVDKAYSGLYIRYLNAPFGNISPDRNNTVSAVLVPEIFERFGNAITVTNNTIGANNLSGTDLTNQTRQILNDAGINVSSGVFQLAQNLIYDVRTGNAPVGLSAPDYKVAEARDINGRLNGDRKNFFLAKRVSGSPGLLYFSGEISAVSVDGNTEADFPPTRKAIIQALEQYITNGNSGQGVNANITSIRKAVPAQINISDVVGSVGFSGAARGLIALASAAESLFRTALSQLGFTNTPTPVSGNPDGVIIDGTIRLDDVVVPYAGTNSAFASQTRKYTIFIKYETNNLLLFRPAPSLATPANKKGSGSGAGGGGSTVKNTVSDTQKDRSDGFQSALHAMLTIVQAEVQARADEKKNVAWLSIDKSTTYKNIVNNFFAKGILNGVLDPTSVTTNPDLKYALKGFNANLMLDPSLLSQIPDVDFVELTKAFIVRYDQDLDDGIPDTVRCPVYISFGFLLAFLANMCIVYDSTRLLRDIPPGNSNDQRPYFYIDFNPKTNLCLTFPQQFSVDPFVCLIPFNATDSEYKSIFPPATLAGAGLKFNPQKTNPLLEKLTEAKYNFQSDSANRGEIMKILLNVDYLLNLLSEFQYSDPEHAVNLQPFIERILVDVGKATGNANYFRLVYRDDANTAQILDYQICPRYQSPFAQETTMTDRTAYNNNRRSTDLDTRITSGELPVFGSGSLAREFQLKTTISTNLAKIIAISASPATGSINATDHSSFSTLNELYVDRYKPYPGDAASVQAAANTNTKGSSTKANDVKAAEFFDKHTININSSFKVAKSDIEQAKNYYIERISKVKSGLPEAVATAPIPANAEITIDGISGILMYNAFTIPEERLPISLRGLNGNARFGFITSGLVHTIENNQWLTKLTGQMFPLRESSGLGRSVLFVDPNQISLAASTGPTPGTFSRVPRGTDLFRGNNASSTSDYLLGSPKRVPNTPAHPNWGGRANTWPNNNAWDLGANAGTPVYAIVDGTVTSIYFSENNDTVWGYSFTLVGGRGSFFYTHLDHVTVKSGTTVSRGDLVGYIGLFPDSYGTRLVNFPHLHIGVQNGKLTNYVDLTGKFI